MKYRKLILGTAFFAAIAAISLPQIKTWVPNRQETQKIGIIGQYNSSNLPIEVTGFISEGLTKLNPDGTVSPGLATSWEIKDDSKTYIFKIDPSRTWHDGKTVNANEINYNFKDVQVNPLPENYLEFKLTDAYVPFLTTVSRPVFQEDLVGVGSYKVADIKSAGQSITQINLNPVSSSQAPLVFRFYPTEDIALTAFKLGEIDTIYDLSVEPDLVLGSSTKVESTVRQDRFVALLFNTQDESLSSKNVRQALAYAINKSQFPNRAISPLNPNSWAYNTQVKPYDQDMDKAKGTIKQEKIEGHEIELSTFSWLLPTAEKIKADWEQAGVKVNIKVASFIPEDFDVLLAAQKIPPDPDQYSLWHSTQTSNITRLKNPRIDKFLEDGRKTADQTARQKIYLDFQRFLVEESPAIFLYYPVSYSITRK